MAYILSRGCELKMLDYVIIGLLSLILILLIVMIISSKRKPDNRSEQELKLYLQKEYGELKVFLTQMVNDSVTSHQKDNYMFKDFMLQQIDLKFKEINDKVESKLGEGFDNTTKTFINVAERLARIDEAQKKIESLSTEVISLNDLLKGQKTRGIVGERQLYQILDNIFSQKQSLYIKQAKLSNNTIVDALIHMPDNIGNIAIDAKFPLANYQKMIDPKLAEDERNGYKKDFKQNIKKHIDDIKNKYIISGETSEFAIMYLPAESLFSEVYANHDDLVEYAETHNILLASPMTLLYMLTMVLVVSNNTEKHQRSGEIIKELKDLGELFKRHLIRWNKLKNTLDTVKNQAHDVETTSDKIHKRFNRISNVSFEYDDDSESDDISDE